MIPFRHPQNPRKPWATFITTYDHDYRAYDARELFGPAWAEAEAVHARVKAPQTHLQLGTDNWPLSVKKYFYQTTNSTYGSGVCGTPEQTASFPVCPPETEASAVRIQEPSDEEKQERQLQPVLAGKAETSKQQEAKDDPKPEAEVSEDGSVLLLCPGGGACSTGCLGCACRDAVLQYLLRSAGTSGPVFTVKDGDATLLRSVAGLKHSAAPVAGPTHCTCWLCPARCPFCGCFRTQSAPGGGMQPLQPVVEYREPSRTEWVTEYQASFVNPWAKPRM